MRSLALLLLFAALLPAQQMDPALRADQAKQALADGRFDDAAKIYSDLVRIIPNNPGLLVNLGMALHMSGHDAEAIGPLQQAVSIEPSIFPAWLFLGGSHLRLGQPVQSIEPLERALKLQPDYLEARQMLADAYSQLGRHRDALGQLKILTNAAPDVATGWAVMTQLYDALAAEAFDALQREAPESALMVKLIADVRMRQQQYPSAFYLYRQALERDPKIRGAHAAIAEVYRQTERGEWAAQEEQKEAALGEPDCAAEKLLCDFAAGKFESVAAAAPRGPEGYYWAAQAYNQLAAQTFARLDAFPPSEEKHVLLAQLYSGQERYAESAKELEQALKASPGNPEYARELATQLYLARDFAAAKPRLEALVQQDPNFAQWKYFLGDLLLQQQQMEAAVPLLEKAVALDPGLAPAKASLGRAYMLMDQPDKAIPHLLASLDLDPDGSAHYQLAQAYIRTGQRDLAREPMQKYQQMQQAVQAQQRASQELEITAPEP